MRILCCACSDFCKLIVLPFLYRYVKTLCGRKRFLDKINHGKWGEKAKAERQAVNSICQVGCYKCDHNIFLLFLKNTSWSLA